MNKPRILVVDDECGFTHLLQHVLFRYEIREVNDPQRALETARQFKPIWISCWRRLGRTSALARPPLTSVGDNHLAACWVDVHG